MPSNTAQSLAGLTGDIHARLAAVNLHVAVEIDGDTLVLSGLVDSPENRDAALDVARALADQHGLRVDDAIEITSEEPLAPLDPGNEDFPAPSDSLTRPDDDDLMLEPDLTDDIGTTDSMEAAEEAEPYFPPTDPVVRPSNSNERLEIAGGFGATADHEEYEGDPPLPASDDDLAEAVLRELRDDALTADLPVRVVARDGIVHLRGELMTLEDAESAEFVAARVPGVREVREECTITSLTRSPLR